MSSIKAIGEDLVKLCNEGKNMDCVNKYYAEDVVSVEAQTGPGSDSREAVGIEAVRAKGKWWEDNHEVHSSKTEGPFPHGDDRFAAIFDMDVTMKASGQRIQMHEIGVFHVRDGKIVREEFFYDM